MNPRADPHRPSAIDPADYEFVAYEYLGSEPDGAAEMLANRDMIRAHMARTGGTYSRHVHGGNCHICGAHAIYTALFYHARTNAYVRTGLECADKLGCGDAEGFRSKIRAAIEQHAGKRKALTVLAAAGLERAWTIFVSPITCGKRGEHILMDVIHRLVKYGSISEAQIGLLRRLLDQFDHQEEIDAARAAEKEAAAPLPVVAGRVTVIATILSIRTPDDSEGFPTTRKMLVRHASGWKAWGSLPATLAEARVGDEVTFDATLKPSRDDRKFGFFSRPTKARVERQRTDTTSAACGDSTQPGCAP